MDPIFMIIFGISAVLVMIWLVLDTFRRTKQRGELRREIYLKELENAAAEYEVDEEARPDKEQ